MAKYVLSPFEFLFRCSENVIEKDNYFSENSTNGVINLEINSVRKTKTHNDLTLHLFISMKGGKFHIVLCYGIFFCKQTTRELRSFSHAT